MRHPAAALLVVASLATGGCATGPGSAGVVLEGESAEVITVAEVETDLSATIATVKSRFSDSLITLNQANEYYAILADASAKLDMAEAALLPCADEVATDAPCSESDAEMYLRISKGLEREVKRRLGQ